MHIDWKKVADENGLSFKEFRDELFLAAAAMGAAEIDSGEDENSLSFRFETEDESGCILVYVIRKVD